MFRSLLIANRGEIAARVIRTCKRMGVRAIAAYSEADADSPHLAAADATVLLGGAKSAESYLDMAAVLRAAEATDASAIHPGYGFLSENPLFAALCRQARRAFIGPPPSATRLLGDKASARLVMARAGLPIIPGSQGVLGSVEEALEAARRAGFPVLLKASAGGGGRGMRACADEAGLRRAWEEASLEARKAFGDPRLYLEKLIQGGRHIEFQFLADSYGKAVHLGERECSVQRRHQKLIEESPSPVLEPGVRANLGARVCAAVAAAGYTGAGTAEFLRAPSGEMYFLEVNARLQVEHPVTEEVYGGIDLVEQQLRIAANERLALEQHGLHPEGHAIECRINAEDAEQGFRPSPGLVCVFDPPAEVGVPGVRVRLESHVRPGYRIPIHYDSLIGKLIVWGPDREAARRGMMEALDRFRIEGVPTTIPFLRRVLDDPGFASGDYDTTTVDRMFAASPA